MPTLPRLKVGLREPGGLFRIGSVLNSRLHKISTLEEANHYLLEEFIPKYNRMFSHPAKEPGSAYRPVPQGLDLNNIFCLKEERTVASDNTISYKAKSY